MRTKITKPWTQTKKEENNEELVKIKKKKKKTGAEVGWCVRLNFTSETNQGIILQWSDTDAIFDDDERC